jgi:signal transduction histidine kinase
MNDIFREVVELIRAKADSQKISISQDYGELPSVLVDPELMKTCIYNIVLNAFQSMPEGGGLSIRTSADGSGVRVSISDTGIGVPEENLEKIFEPFFSTKGGGLGLGLATTKRIVEEHGGRISFESKSGEGSVVSVTLPLNVDAPGTPVNTYRDTA